MQTTMTAEQYKAAIRERWTECEFQSAVIVLARLCDWRVAHFRPGMNARGDWRTAVQGDGDGFPDLVLLRGGRIVVIELKVKKNKPMPEQEQWLAAWRQTAAAVLVAWPKDWEAIEEVLA